MGQKGKWEKGGMKGNFSEMDIEEESEVNANGGKQTIIDITKPNGDRVMVDSDYKITMSICYKVTSGYQPYQDLERDIKVSFLVDRKLLRDDKINQLLS